MEVIELIGERMYLDHLITSTFNYSYQDSKITVQYDSYIEVADVENKITELQNILSNIESSETVDKSDIQRVTTAIQILTDLKNRLT